MMLQRSQQLRRSIVRQSPVVVAGFTFPSMVIVALGELGVPSICCAASGAAMSSDNVKTGNATAI